MACFCYLPSCLQCHPMLDDAWGIGTSIQLAVAKSHPCTQLQGNACREKKAAVGFQRSGPTNGRPDCSCLLPECETCSKRSMMAAPSSSAHALGRGNAMPGRGLRLIAAVHDEFSRCCRRVKDGLRKERAGIELLLCARILIPTMHHGSRRLLPDCVDAPSGWSERLVPTARRVMWRQCCVEGNGVAWNMQLPLMARSPPRRLLVAFRHCGKEGWRRHRCSPPQHAIAWGTFEASSCHWQWETPYSTRLA